MVAEILIIPDNAAPEAAKAGAQYMARSLTAVGVKVRESVSLCTDIRKVQQAVSAALGRSNIIVVIGGMDRGTEYMSKTVIAKGLSLPLERNAEGLAAIREYCLRTGESFHDGDEALADLPQGGRALNPAFGKTPGCIISSSTQHIILLPQSQQELANMFGRFIAPFLSGNEASEATTHVIRAYGVSEAYVRDKLDEIMTRPNPAVTLQKDGVEVLIRVSAHAASGADAAAVAAPALKEIARRLGDAAYGFDVDSIQAAAVAKMVKKDLGLAIAEAGTNGMLTRVISETPGGQDILRYSAVADDDEAKISKFEADAGLLKKRGGVSEYAAVLLAAGARSKSGASVGVGVAANTADFEDRKSTPGLVYIAVCDREHVYVKKLVIGEGDAVDDVIIDAAISRALNMLRLFVDYMPGVYKGCVSLSEALRGKTAVTERDSYEEDMADEAGEGKKKRFIDNFIIRKADEPGSKVRKFILLLAILVFVGCAGYLGLYYYQSHAALMQARTLQGLYDYGDLADVEVSPNFPAQYSKDFGALWTLNPD
ncbi:MAG: CinA family protein, partial [Oscillospiraceae bacterium]|nr:CinA family protein [Oscillospiraceae bacterium]